jgi:thymidylate synthase
MNNLDKQYQALLQDILDNGVKKEDRTGTGTISVFGRQIRHKMSEGFPLLTTKKMAWKVMVTELAWFLRGDTNIKFLVENGCNIWNGDAYKNFEKWYDNMAKTTPFEVPRKFTEEELVKAIKLDPWHAEKFGELGPIYGKQWRSWENFLYDNPDPDSDGFRHQSIDQIQNLINDLKTNPDSRRLMVNAWNVGELNQMVLPPCHYGFQVYTRELNLEERIIYFRDKVSVNSEGWPGENDACENFLNERNIPTRAISLMWNQRSVDTFLGLPFNIASYGLLLMMLADEVNMVPDELIGNLGDVHLYSNHIEQAKEQIGRELTLDERMDWWFKNKKPGRDICDHVDKQSPYGKGVYFDFVGVPKHTREPMKLPTVHIRDGIYSFMPDDVILENYESHPAIKAPLSN